MAKAKKTGPKATTSGTAASTRPRIPWLWIGVFVALALWAGW